MTELQLIAYRIVVTIGVTLLCCGILAILLALVIGVGMVIVEFFSTLLEAFNR